MSAVLDGLDTMRIGFIASYARVASGSTWPPRISSLPRISFRTGLTTSSPRATWGCSAASRHTLGVTEFDLLEYEGRAHPRRHARLVGQLVARPAARRRRCRLSSASPASTSRRFRSSSNFGPPSGETTRATLAEQALDLFLKGRPGPYELLLPEVDIGLRFDPDKLRPMRPKDADDLTKGFEPDPTRRGGRSSTSARLSPSTPTPACGLKHPATSICRTARSARPASSSRRRTWCCGCRTCSRSPRASTPRPSISSPTGRASISGRVQVFNLNTLVEWLPRTIDLEKWFIGRGGVTGKATAVLDLHPDMSAQDFAVRALPARVPAERAARRARAAGRQAGLLRRHGRLSRPGDHQRADARLPGVDRLHGRDRRRPAAGARREPPRQDELVPRCRSTPVLRAGRQEAGRARQARSRARRATSSRTTRASGTCCIDGRVEIGPRRRWPSSVFGGEFTGPRAAGRAAVRLRAAERPVAVAVAKRRGPSWRPSRSRSRASGSARRATRSGSGSTPRSTSARASVRRPRSRACGVFFGGPPGIHLTFDGIELKLDRPGFASTASSTMITGADAEGIADPSDKTFRGDVQLAIASGVGVELEGSVLFGTKDGTRFGYVALDADLRQRHPDLLVGLVVRRGAARRRERHTRTGRWPATRATTSTGISTGTRLHRDRSRCSTRASGSPVDDGWAAGAGVTIGSSDGKAWSLRALLAVVAPGPVVIIEGRLRILKTREPHSGPAARPRRSAGSWCSTSTRATSCSRSRSTTSSRSRACCSTSTPRARCSTATVPATGTWRSAGPSRSAAASGPRRCGCSTGTPTSSSAARDLELADRTFPGTALAVGYRTGIDKRGKWGPVRGVLAVWIAGDVALSFNPRYVLAEVSLHGEASIKVFGIGFELMLDALLALEAPVDDDDVFFGGKVRIKLGSAVAAARHQEGHPLRAGATRARCRRRSRRWSTAPRSARATRWWGSGSTSARPAPSPTSSLPLDGRVTITFQRPLRSSWPGAPTPVDLAQPDRVGDVYYRYTLIAVRVRVTPRRRLATRRHRGPLRPVDARPRRRQRPAGGEPGAVGADAVSRPPATLPGPAAPSAARGRTCCSRPTPRWPCGTLPPTERCVDFELVPLGVYDPELRYRPDPAYGAVVFTPWPNAARKDDVDGQVGEPVQVPLAIVNAGATGAEGPLPAARPHHVPRRRRRSGAAHRVRSRDGVTSLGREHRPAAERACPRPGGAQQRPHVHVRARLHGRRAGGGDRGKRTGLRDRLRTPSRRSTA